MADEPTDLTHRMLREIRAGQEALEQSVAAQGDKIDALVKEVGELKGWVVHALGVVTTEHLKNREQDSQIEELDDRLSVAIRQFEDALKDR